MTALLDAMGKAIDDVGARLAAKPETERPSKVVVVVITDGHENSSTRFTRAQIAEKVKHQESVYGWQFAFLGANIDSFGEADSLGISGTSTMDFQANAQGVGMMYGALNRSIATYRTAGANATLALDADDDDSSDQE